MPSASASSIANKSVHPSHLTPSDCCQFMATPPAGYLSRSSCELRVGRSLTGSPPKCIRTEYGNRARCGTGGTELDVLIRLYSSRLGCRERDSNPHDLAATSS